MCLQRFQLNPEPRHGDGDVDIDDFEAVEECIVGPGGSCDPTCATCAMASAQVLVTPESSLLDNSGSGLGHRSPNILLKTFLIIIVVGLVISTILFTTCYQPACRTSLKSTFWYESEQPDLGGLETAHIVAALNKLQFWGQSNEEAQRARNWFLGKLPNPDLSNNVVWINRWLDEDREGLVAATQTQADRIVVHEKWVTGEEYSADVLALILLAEWQHVDCGSCSEQNLQGKLDEIREDLGIVNLAPEIKHGWIDGEC